MLEEFCNDTWKKLGGTGVSQCNENREEAVVLRNIYEVESETR